jgi:lambda family phage portal protein
MDMNAIDKMISYFNPEKGLSRAKARRSLKVQARYEATKPNRQIKNPAEYRDANGVNEGQIRTLRGQARHLDENYDFVSGGLDVLVRNTVGANGIAVIPMPRNAEGELNKELAKQLRHLWIDFCEQPEVTKQLNWATACQLMARSLFRDGEVFSKSIIGNVAGLDHKTTVPYSLELLEADYCPESLSSAAITQGVEFNAWSQPVAFHFTDNHPGANSYSIMTRRISADRVDHLKMVKRLGQARGITPLASAINRLNALSEYEHHEQIAAAIGASMAAYIQKGDASDYAAPTDEAGNPVDIKRDFQINGTSLFELEEGETMGTVQSNRPSGLLTPYVKFMMKGFAAAIGTSHSSTAKDYDGSYSAQRQELVEITENYRLLTGVIVSKWVRPVWRRFVETALLLLPPELWDGVETKSLSDAVFMGPQMPWIDPLKEANAFDKLVAMGVASPQEIITKRGLNPIDVLDQIEEWKSECAARGIQFAALADSDVNEEDEDKNDPNEKDKED